MLSGGSAVAVTSLALANLLRQAVAVVPGANVAIGPPRAVSIGEAPTVGLHLVHVDAATLPAPSLAPRRPGVAFTPRPRTLELDYVVSFGGDFNVLEPEILLGLVIDAFAATPVVIVDAGVAAFQSMHPDLAAPTGIESIRVTPLALSAADRAALWLMLSTPYRLSVEYRAQVQTS